MRILKVTQSYYPFLDKGGPTVKVRALARGMAAAGHQVTVLSADQGFDAAIATTVFAGAMVQDWVQKTFGLPTTGASGNKHTGGVAIASESLPGGFLVEEAGELHREIVKIILTFNACAKR